MLQFSKFNIGMMINNKYEIKREIARGGMGIVYESYDHYAKRQIAIKIILANKIDTLQLKRFQKEIEAYSRLSHPNVIKIYDVGIYENNPYIVMEYIDGVDICQYVAQHDPAYGQKNNDSKLATAGKENQERDWKLCAKLIYETALGLEYIHKQKMFHRDIKPSNILVRSNGSPVIIDLGLVKFNQERSYNLTRSKDIVGTVQYMPIEQVKGKRGEIDESSDVYSLGLVLYELLTEQQAYKEKNITDLFEKIVSYFPPSPKEINQSIPNELDKIVMHSIEKQKNNRYTSAIKFANELKAYLKDTPKGLIYSNNHRKKIIIAVTLLLIISGMLFTMLYNNRFSNKIQIEQATEFFLPIAQQGNEKAQFMLGLIYDYGIDKEKDEQKALYWYEKAAEQGYAQAQFTLGNIFYNTKTRIKNLEKAYYWYEKAANQGHIDAQNILGSIFRNGLGIKKDEQKALYWYEQAANQGHIDAQYTLGEMYYNFQRKGTIPRNLEKAHYWLEKAGIQGHAQAQFTLGVIYFNNYPPKFPQNFIKAYYWWEKASHLGNSSAQYHLGILYYYGQGVKQDLEKSIYYFQQAANAKNQEALHVLERIYKQKLDKKQDTQK